MSSGYEIFGLDNIPNKGPALIICFHGVFPIDMYYLAAKVFLVNKRLIITVAHRQNFKFIGKLLINR